MKIKAKRLILIPLEISQMELLCDGQDKVNSALNLNDNGIILDEHLKTAYKEMYNACLNDEKKYLWHTNWQIILKEENKSIGSVGFMGVPNEKYEVEIGYGIDEKYRKCGYAKEALDAVLGWALSNGAYYVQAQTEIDNIASIKLLEKCKFERIESANENLLFELEKPKSAWMSIYMCLGMSVGMCFGISLDKTALGMCFGVAIGMLLGLLLDENDKKCRKKKE